MRAYPVSMKPAVPTLEVEDVQDPLRENRLSSLAPAMDPDACPWPIKVYTLGRFAVLIEGEPLRFDRKVQKKPLELLKALIALGGHEVSAEVIVDALWPQAEGDAAVQALATTVHRLRKLLGAAVVRCQAGHLSLDADHCWVDAWALERALARVEKASGTGELEVLRSRVEAVFHLYRGTFLESEYVASWMLAPRERLRAKLLRTLASAGQALARNGDHAQAIACYEKALEVEPLAEECYCELIRCYLADGRRANALSIYQRCQRLLTAQLGLSPSPETEALHREIRKC